MSDAIRYPTPEPPVPLLPMSWLGWSRAEDEYVGGDYRIRLIGPTGGKCSTGESTCNSSPG